ncbi:hypothetical protein ENBRE01_2740 [Enteropsectra breve]|nr:hypothetical protein ENBRE01_2740 [Enteropsectra breve]
MFLTQQKPILTFVDYYTRVAKAIPIAKKEPSDIITALKTIFEELGNPSLLVSDNGKEFVNSDTKKFLHELNITQHTIYRENIKQTGELSVFIWIYGRRYAKKTRT